MLGEELKCTCEMGNVYDLYAVGVLKMGTGIVGHLPKKISMPCLYFIYDHWQMAVLHQPTSIKKIDLKTD